MTSINADVYALQEIDDVDAFETLNFKLEGYSSFILPDQYSNLKLAYLVKSGLIVDFFHLPFALLQLNVRQPPTFTNTH